MGQVAATFAAPTNAVYADGTANAFTYDASGLLLTAERTNSLQSTAYSRLAFAYDAMNRLTSAVTRADIALFASAEYRVGYAYDAGGLVTNTVYPDGGSVRTAYDADGRVASVTDWAGRAWTFSRDAAGRLTSLSCPNGVTGSWAYDANHAVASWGYSSGGNPFAGRTVTRDAAGIKTEEHVTTGLFPNPQNPRRASNSYDAADRLVSAQVVSGTNAFAEVYLYDACGALTNRQSEVGGQRSEVGEQRYGYDCAGRMSSLQLLNPNSSLLLSYDAPGNLLRTVDSRTQGGSTLWVTDHADPLKRPLANSESFPTGNRMRFRPSARPERSQTSICGLQRIGL